MTNVEKLYLLSLKYSMKRFVDIPFGVNSSVIFFLLVDLLWLTELHIIRELTFHVFMSL